MITTMAAYPAALQDLPPLGQTGLTDASMNDNNNNNNNCMKVPLNCSPGIQMDFSRKHGPELSVWTNRPTGIWANPLAVLVL